MSGAIGAIIAALIVAALYRRQQGWPAKALRDGTGYLLRHARWERVLAWSALAASALPAALAGELLRERGLTRGVEAAAVLLGCSGFLGALGVWACRYVQRRIRVNDSGITLYRGRKRAVLEIPWGQVNGVSTDLLGELLICSRNGSQIAVHKTMVGVPTLVEFIRRHLRSDLYSSTFRYYRPRAHLRSPIPEG